MWRVTAEEDLTCTECWHAIGAGSECLSQMPADMPDKVRRRGYESFCIECSECGRRGKGLCYVRRLDHWYIRTAKTKEAVRCGYCDGPIPEGTRTVVQKLYAWPDSESATPRSAQLDGGGDTAAGAAGAASARAATRAHSGAWRNLSPETQRIFQTRGLGRGLGSRSPAMARRFYETSIPEAVRNQGEGAVRNFLNGKHASHIKSVSKTPGLAKRPRNVVWEDAGGNLSRGNRNMTAGEVAAIESANRVSAIRAVAKGAAKGGLISAAIEAPVAGMENFFHWKRGRKSRERSAVDAAKSTAAAGAVGAGVTAGAAGVAKGAALVGISPTLGPAGLPLAVAGGALMAGFSVYRVIKAAKLDLPLYEYTLFFCKDADCKTRFAQDVIGAAPGRD